MQKYKVEAKRTIAGHDCESQGKFGFALIYINTHLVLDQTQGETQPLPQPFNIKDVTDISGTQAL